MAELTPEERERIYLEEKERKEAEEQAIRDKIYAEEKVRHEARTRIWKEETGRLLKSAKGLTGISKSVVQYARAKAGVSIAVLVVLVLGGVFWWQTHNFGPNQTVAKFNESILARDYVTAYSLLHPDSDTKAQFRTIEGYKKLIEAMRHSKEDEDYLLQKTRATFKDPQYNSDGDQATVFMVLPDTRSTADIARFGQVNHALLTTQYFLRKYNGQWRLL